MTPTSLALNRFGLGARPHDAAIGDAKHWLEGQFARFEAKPAALAAAAGSAQIIGELADAYIERKDFKGKLLNVGKKAKELS